MRLFAALWPTEVVRSHLLAALRSSVGVDPQESPGRYQQGVRWTAAECWHITLAFYGEVGDAYAADLAAGLAEVARDADPLELHLRGAGVFSQRTFWVGVGGDVDVVHGLADASRTVGERCGLRGDRRVRSRPHLTLGRLAAAGPTRRGRCSTEVSPADLLAHALAVYQGPDWPVHSLSLVRSEPGRGRAGGPLFTALDEWEFGQG